MRAVATTIATTTSPAKDNADSLSFLKDATVVVQKSCCISSIFSSSRFYSILWVRPLSSADLVAVGLETKPFNLGLSLKDNTQPQFPIAVSSLSSLSSKDLT
jgi:hypothetical protein